MAWNTIQNIQNYLLRNIEMIRKNSIYQVWKAVTKCALSVMNPEQSRKKVWPDLARRCQTCSRYHSNYQPCHSIQLGNETVHAFEASSFKVWKLKGKERRSLVILFWVLVCNKCVYYTETHLRIHRNVNFCSSNDAWRRQRTLMKQASSYVAIVLKPCILLIICSVIALIVWTVERFLFCVL